MGAITGRRYYCVRCHNRPVEDSIWRAGGKGAHLCELCDLNDREKERDQEAKRLARAVTRTKRSKR